VRGPPSCNWRGKQKDFIDAANGKLSIGREKVAKWTTLRKGDMQNSHLQEAAQRRRITKVGPERIARRGNHSLMT